MRFRKLLASLAAASLIVIPAQRVQANDGAALLGGLLLGGIIVNEVNKNNQRKRAAAASSSSRARTYSGVSASQREQNRQVQTALNYFGYNVGVVDGSLGRNSRAGISRYQAEMGYHADGYLDSYEQEFLLNSYQRAMVSAGVPPYNTIMASQGQAGLLRTFRNEQLGIPTPGIQTAAAQAPAPAPAPVAAPAPTVAKTVPEREAPAAPAALPEFTFGQVDRSVSEFCNEINVLTAANGGLTTSGRVTDPEFSLNEQFCLARTHAMSESTSIVATIPNLTDAQIKQQCDGLTQAVAPQMNGLDTARPDQVIGKTATFLQGSGRQMDQLVAAGKVCLGLGYRVDDPSMALASAVLLASAGQLGYGEMVSHQLREGLGTAKASPEQARAWMTLALDSLGNGGTMVMGQSPDRVAVLTQASNGGAGSGSAVLPVFPSTSSN